MNTKNMNHEQQSYLGESIATKFSWLLQIKVHSSYSLIDQPRHTQVVGDTTIDLHHPRVAEVASKGGWGYHR